MMGSFPNFQETVIVVAAFVAGNFCWWLGLASVVSRVRHRVSPRRIQVMNRFAALAFIGFGVVLVLRGSMAYEGTAFTIVGDALIAVSAVM